MLDAENKTSTFRVVITILLWFGLSWGLIHVLALLGWFLTLAYPVWWLFAPSKSICFICRAKHEGSYCFLCKETIIKEDGIEPTSLSSAIYNGMIILLFTFFSFGLVFLESKILYNMGFPPTPKTVSFVIPTKGQYRLGEIFPMKIEIAGIKTPINAIQADLGFDPTRLEIIDISTDESFANIFIQKELNNEAGYGRLTGGLPNPGFFSDHGVFGSVLFRGKAPGVVKIEFLPSSMVLANDGRGTNVLKDLTSVSYLILPERISQAEEEMQEEISIQSTVLGESTDNTQMKFYEETKVLGAKVEEEIQEKKKFNLFKVFFDILGEIDRFILNLYHKLFDSIFNLD